MEKNKTGAQKVLRVGIFSLSLSQSCIISNSLYVVVREGPAMAMTLEESSEVSEEESCAHG